MSSANIADALDTRIVCIKLKEDIKKIKVTQNPKHSGHDRNSIILFLILELSSFM